MKIFEDKKHTKARLYSRMTVVILILFVLLLAKSVFGLYVKNRESIAARNASETKLQALKDREASLKEEINRLENNEGMEWEIRDKFNVTKPGENVVIIVPDDEATSTPPQKGFFSRLFSGLW